MSLVPRRIVLNSWGSLGDLFPYIALGRALQTRGSRAVGQPEVVTPSAEQPV